MIQKQKVVGVSMKEVISIQPQTTKVIAKIVARRLEKGVKDGAFQQVWLEKFERGELTFIDYLAITALQFQKNIK